MSTSSVNTLVYFLFAKEESIARKLVEELRQAGVPTPMKFGEDLPLEVDTANLTNRARRRASVLIELSRAALERAVKGFDGIRERIEKRIRRARLIKLASAILTTGISSAVVASLKINPSSDWGIVLGVLAVIASLLTIIATYLEGGDLKLAEQFAEVAAKHAESRSLLERLAAYAKEPELFEDIDERLDEAAALVVFLEKATADWISS